MSYCENEGFTTMFVVMLDEFVYCAPFHLPSLCGGSVL